MDSIIQFRDSGRVDDLELLFRSYFRVIIPEVSAEARQALQNRPQWIRKHIAATSMHPHIIFALIGDSNSAVSKTARQNRYWAYLGRFQELEQKSQKERLRVATTDSGPRLLALLFFENDYCVLLKVLNNPNLGIEERQFFKKFCALRSIPAIDRHLSYQLNQAPETTRKNHRITKSPGSIADIRKTFRQLCGDNREAVGKARQKLDKIDLGQLSDYLRPNQPLWQSEDFPALSLWKILTRLHASGNAACKNVAAKRFETMLAMSKLHLVRHCANDLTKDGHLLIMACAHTDRNAGLRRQAERFLELDALFDILEDCGTPAGLSLPALKILRRHPISAARARAAEILVSLNKRSRAALREMEDSIKAFFDIISNSNLFQKNKKKASAKKGELTYLYEIITQLRELPDQIFRQTGNDTATTLTSSKRQLLKARLLWRVTVGQYLGRIKAFSSIISGEWLKHLKGDLTPEDFKRDFDKCIGVIEQEYKNSVNCKLSINCVQCKKRTCAADRFLKQVDFLLAELLEFTN